MSISRYSRSLGADVSRSRLIMGLLVLILFLVLGLAWQANRTMQTNRTTATNVLQDYARLVADEYARRAMGEVGYYGYYTYINVLRRQALEESSFPFQVTKPDADSREERASRLVSRPRSSVTTTFANFVSSSSVSAMTQTPASGPLSLVTDPAMTPSAIDAP